MSAPGGCLCGAVRYTLSEAPTEYGACHCGMCRKFSGGIELGVHVMPGGITFDRDDTLATYASSEWAERGFCKICGSSLFWRLTAPGPMHGMMSVSVGSLDSMEGLSFNTEVYIDAKPESYAFAGDRNRMTEADVMAMVNAGPESGA
ncbi:MAG: GFA family protein [Pseudomonadota bacterium]